MPILIITKNSNFYNIFPVKNEISIGRREDNDIVLDSKRISGHHATVKMEGSAYYLIDHKSKNHTYVSGIEISRHHLKHGDSFVIADFVCTFIEDVNKKSIPLFESAEIPVDKTDTADETLWADSDTVELTEHLKQIRRIIQIILDIQLFSDSDDITQCALDGLFEIMDVKRGLIALGNNAETLMYKDAKGFSKDLADFKISRVIFKKVVEEGQLIFKKDAVAEDPSASIYAMQLKSVICAPLVSENEILGCIYLDNPDAAGCFTLQDRDIVLLLSKFIADAVYTARQERELWTKNNKEISRHLRKKGVIAVSEKLIEVFRNAKRCAEYDLSVLIYGETGTGKEKIAHYLHEQSNRTGKFIIVNSAAVTDSMFESEFFGIGKNVASGVDPKPGLIEAADKGTLFFDEIGDMPPKLQTKLLRVLQDRKVRRVGELNDREFDVRFIAATHVDLEDEQVRGEKQFRNDLYYRLKQTAITIPPLRERKEDIPPLCEYFLDISNNKKNKVKISSSALKTLEQYHWPGNVRELESVIYQAITQCDGKTIRPKLINRILSKTGTSAHPDLVSLEEIEKEHIMKVLNHAEWNKVQAAGILDINRNRLSRMIKKYKLE